jgi:hypothetical protein
MNRVTDDESVENQDFNDVFLATCSDRSKQRKSATKLYKDSGFDDMHLPEPEIITQDPRSQYTSSTNTGMSLAAGFHGKRYLPEHDLVRTLCAHAAYLCLSAARRCSTENDRGISPNFHRSIPSPCPIGSPWCHVSANHPHNIPGLCITNHIQILWVTERGVNRR